MRYEVKGECIVDGCEKGRKGRGMCSSHYNKWRESAPGLPACSVEGCETGAAGGGGMCPMHYQRTRTTGDPGPAGRLIGINKGFTCKGPECQRGAWGKGYCQSHLKQFRKGDPVTVIKESPTRGMSVVDKIAYHTPEAGPGGCREWEGGSISHGYPCLGDEFMGTKLVHRMVYMMGAGEVIPSYVPVHHTCANSLCVEVSHLQAVTPIENAAEMMERNWYKARIEALEGALADLRPEHPLLVRP